MCQSRPFLSVYLSMHAAYIYYHTPYISHFKWLLYPFHYAPSRLGRVGSLLIVRICVAQKGRNLSTLCGECLKNHVSYCAHTEARLFVCLSVCLSTYYVCVIFHLLFNPRDFPFQPQQQESS